MDEQIKTYIKLNMAHTKETCITPAVISRQLPKLYIGVSSSRFSEDGGPTHKKATTSDYTPLQRKPLPVSSILTLVQELETYILNIPDVALVAPRNRYTGLRPSEEPLDIIR